MRVLVFDRTCVRTGGGLTIPWFVGSHLYRALRRFDRVKGVASWSEALAWLGAIDQPIDELQYWGHGRWGRFLVDKEALTTDSLLANHEHHAGMRALRDRLAPGGLVWFRTCSAFGTWRGMAFAEALADFLGARVAGHTHVIGFHQSGLHGLVPGARAHWHPAEGLADGTPDEPAKAKGSWPWAARTITCLHGAVPEAWFRAPS
ncbi:MAG: hypothetical protein AB7T06_48185 [Kofleriaceae bacterium]